MEGNALVTGGGARYAAVVVPASRYIPLETLSQLVALANQGRQRARCSVDFAADVAGLADLSNRRDQLRRAIAAIQFGPAGADGIAEALVGRGRILRGETSTTLLRGRASPANRWSITGWSSRVVDRNRAGSTLSATRSAVDFDGWVPVGVTARASRGARSDARHRAGGPDAPVRGWRT